MDALFLADSFVKSFGKNRVLKSATAWARAGEVTVLLGRNGCGKSTLLRAALGLCTSEVGLVRYDGEAFLRPRLWRLAARGLFYLPDRHLLSRRLRFGDQLELIKTRFGVGDCDEIITRLEVKGLAGVTPREMSGRASACGVGTGAGPQTPLPDRRRTPDGNRAQGSRTDRRYAPGSGHWGRRRPPHRA